MSSIVTGILISIVSLLSNKARDKIAKNLKETDAEIRKIVVRELKDINCKIDGLSRAPLLASYDYFQQGVDLLNASLDKSNPEQGASKTQHESGEPSIDVQCGNFDKVKAIKLHRAMEKLKMNPDKELETARKRFEKARETVTLAFWNEALSIEDRIFAAKLGIVSEMLEHLDSPDTAITGCLSSLSSLHSLIAIRKTFSVHLRGGLCSWWSWWNKNRRVENIKSVMLINYTFLKYVCEFSSKYVFESLARIPYIELPFRSLHPIINWYEISTGNSMGKELDHYRMEELGLVLDEELQPDLSAVNGQGDVFAGLFSSNFKVIRKTGEREVIELPVIKDRRRIINQHTAGLAIGYNDNIYLVTFFKLKSGSKELNYFTLTIWNKDYKVVKTHLALQDFSSVHSRSVRIAVNKNDDIIIIKAKNPHVYIFGQNGLLKESFTPNSGGTISLNTINDNGFMVSTKNRTAIQIYTESSDYKLDPPSTVPEYHIPITKYSLKSTIQLPEDHKIVSVAFDYVISKIVVLTYVKKKNAYFILCFSEAGELKTLTFFGERMSNEPHPKIKSHPKGPAAVVKMGQASLMLEQ